jgi:hypothetical protein
VSVRKRQRLVAELLDEPAGLNQFLMIKWLNGKDRKFSEKVEKLERALPIVSPQKPPVALGDDQSRGDERRGTGK